MTILELITKMVYGRAYPINFKKERPILICTGLVGAGAVYLKYTQIKERN